LAEVRLDLTAAAPMGWVVVNDPIPAGATILGSGFGGDTPAPAVQARDASEWRPTPTYEERRFDGLRVYYVEVPAGHWTLSYRLRLNNAGDFSLPPTRVEALYLPELFGEWPNAPIEARTVRTPRRPLEPRGGIHPQRQDPAPVGGHRADQRPVTAARDQMGVEQAEHPVLDQGIVRAHLAPQQGLRPRAVQHPGGPCRSARWPNSPPAVRSASGRKRATRPAPSGAANSAASPPAQASQTLGKSTGAGVRAWST
jgi:hypothetical protein